MLETTLQLLITSLVGNIILGIVSIALITFIYFTYLKDNHTSADR